MANIPIEKKAGRSFLMPLLALLALGLLGFFLMRGCADEGTGPDGTTTAAVDTVRTGGAPAGVVPGDTLGTAGAGTGGATGAEISSLGDFNVADLRPYVGRSVRLRDVTPLRVIGDSTFLVAGENNRNMLVVLQGLGEGQEGVADGRYTIREGQALNITGTVVAYPPADTVALNAEDRAAARAQGIYLRARRVAGPDVVRN